MKTTVTGMRRGARRPLGFSIVELMVVLAILAIIAAAATPGFASLINNNRLASASNELTATLQNARMEASRRGKRMVMCPSDDGATCTTGARWRGFISFEDANANDVLDAGETVLRTHLFTPPMEVWTSSNLSADSRIVFRHDGFAYEKEGKDLLAANMRACIPTTYPPQNARDVSVGAGGRVATTPTTDAGPCGAPANP